jgi:hypothetical protein
MDILHTSIKNICFDLSSQGINMSMMDTRKQILFQVKMVHDDFKPYKYNYQTETKQIGINSKYLHSMINSVKRKDKIIMYITKEDPYKLHIDIVPKDISKTIKSYISITNHQNITISEIPTGYTDFVIISTYDYQKMIKELKIINSKVIISSSESHIQFEADIPQVFHKNVVYGEYDPNITFTNEFSIDSLIKIIKLCGINKNMKIYTKDGLPVYFSVGLFDNCKLNIYIKNE